MKCKICGNEILKERGKRNGKLTMGVVETCSKKCSHRNWWLKQGRLKLSEQYRYELNAFLKQKLWNGIRNKRKTGKNIECDITTDDLKELLEKQNWKCALTGLKMTISYNDPFAISIDRIDSKKGYTTDNIQLVCAAANFAKKDFLEKKIKKWFNAIIKNGRIK